MFLMNVCATQDKGFPARRKQYLDVMLHAWKRLDGGGPEMGP